MMCYQCGKRDAKLEGLCEPCFLENQPPLFVKNLKISVCKECGAYYCDSWKDVSLDDIIQEYLHLADCDFTVKEHEHRYTVSVVARQLFHENQTHPLVQQTQFSVYVSQSLCNHCSKMLSGYFEAVLQVRRQDHLLTDEERDTACRIVVSTLRKKDFVSRIAERKEGTDFYFSTIKAARRAATSLKKQLGGRIKESFCVVGQDKQNGTDIVRGTILFSLYSYKKGTIVLCQDMVYCVSGSHQKLHLKNAFEEKVLPWKQVEYLENENQIKILPSSSYRMEECQMIDVSPSQVMIMRPDFSTLYLKRPKDIKVVIGKHYCILFYQEHAYWM